MTRSSRRRRHLTHRMLFRRRASPSTNSTSPRRRSIRRRDPRRVLGRIPMVDISAMSTGCRRLLAGDARSGDFSEVAVVVVYEGQGCDEEEDASCPISKVHSSEVSNKELTTAQPQTPSPPRPSSTPCDSCHRTQNYNHTVHSPGPSTCKSDDTTRVPRRRRSSTEARSHRAVARCAGRTSCAASCAGAW